MPFSTNNYIFKVCSAKIKTFFSDFIISIFEINTICTEPFFCTMAFQYAHFSNYRVTGLGFHVNFRPAKKKKNIIFCMYFHTPEEKSVFSMSLQLSQMEQFLIAILTAFLTQFRGSSKKWYDRVIKFSPWVQ